MYNYCPLFYVLQALFSWIFVRWATLEGLNSAALSYGGPDHQWIGTRTWMMLARSDTTITNMSSIIAPNRDTSLMNRQPPVVLHSCSDNEKNNIKRNIIISCPIWDKGIRPKLITWTDKSFRLRFSVILCACIRLFTNVSGNWFAHNIFITKRIVWN